ncbi:MAG: hypothetical protein ACYDH6_24055 [Acidimicrobiales bacterium]
MDISEADPEVPAVDRAQSAAAAPTSNTWMPRRSRRPTRHRTQSRDNTELSIVWFWIVIIAFIAVASMGVFHIGLVGRLFDSSPMVTIERVLGTVGLVLTAIVFVYGLILERIEDEDDHGPSRTRARQGARREASGSVPSTDSSECL